MFNFIFSLSLFFTCSLLGVKFSSKYKKRRFFFSSLLNFNRDLISSVSFERDNLSIILNKKYESDDFNDVLNQIKIRKQNNQNIEFPDFLKADEIVDIENYINKTGKSDAETQMKILNEYHEIFKLYSDLSISDDKKHGGLIKKMGVIIGIMAFIIAV